MMKRYDINLLGKKRMTSQSTNHKLKENSEINTGNI